MALAPRFTANAFALLDPLLQHALADEGFERPTLAQEQAIPRILSGAHTLLIAPTGMGKTESAVLPVLSALVQSKRDSRGEGERKAEARRRVAAGLAPVSTKRISVIYVTPLRALNRDLMHRLHEWGKSFGVDVRVRHGDTSQSERNRQSREPPDFLITTPETLQVMFTGKRLKEAISGVRWVIVDEVHELAQDERGAQMSVALERLEEWIEEKGGKPFQRIGLSATVGDEREVAAFLGGGRPVEIVRVPVAKKLDLRVISPRPEPRDVATAQKLMCKPDAAAFLNRCLDLVRSHKATLLFVNTRETAEVLAARIRMLDDAFPIAIHHGSLSKDHRIAAEEAFKSGAVRGLICTSSMELGIDIGEADLVIQYTSPRQVTRLVQRVGRAGHRHDLVSNGVVVGQDPDDILEAAVILRRTLDERIEPFKGPQNPLDVLANQLAAMALERGRLNAHSTFELVRRTHAFHDLSYEDYKATLEQIGAQWLVWEEGPDFGPKRKARTYFLENLSMIPDEKTFRVLNMVTRKGVATLDEGFVASFVEPSAAFVCQGQAWRVVEVKPDRSEIWVEPIRDPLGAIPSWIGEEIPVPQEVAEDVGRMRAEAREIARESGEEGAIEALGEKYRLDAGAAWKTLAYVEEQGAYELPTDRVSTIDFGPSVVVLNVCGGSKLNETLGRLLSALLTARLGQSVGLQVDPYRVVLTWPGRPNRALVREVIASIEPATVRPLLEMILASSHYLRRRMLHVARKFGALARDVDYERVNVGRLLDLFRGTPLHREALRETFEEKLDVAACEALLAKWRSGEIGLVEQDLSPIGIAGLDQRIELISPARADKTLLEALRKRLQDEELVLACLNCREWRSETRVARAAKQGPCPKCGAKLLGVYRPWNELAKRAASKKGRLTPEEKAELARLTTSANLVFDHGEKALLALVARGVGPDTAGRLLSRQKESEDGFLRDILEAEVTYARTRQFWD